MASRTLPAVHAPRPTGALMDLGNLPDRWRMLAAEFPTLENLPSLGDARLLSARAFDESQVAGPRTSMAVHRYLGVARDNHEALLALLEHHGATLWAPWSLLRPIFEGSFFATWILDPESGRDRRLRGLRSEVLDFSPRRAHRAAFKRLPEARSVIEDAERQETQGLAGRIPLRGCSARGECRPGPPQGQHRRRTGDVDLRARPGGFRCVHRGHLAAVVRLRARPRLGHARGANHGQIDEAVAVLRPLADAGWRGAVAALRRLQDW
jgi:hypothetical protein